MSNKVIVFVTLFFSIAILNAESTSNNSKPDSLQLQKAKMKQFIKKSGFVGTYKLVPDNRIFTEISGTFPLPEPTDTIMFKANCQIIMKNLRKMLPMDANPLTLSSGTFGRSGYVGEPKPDLLMSLRADFQQSYNGTYLTFLDKKDAYTQKLVDQDLTLSLSIVYINLEHKYWILNDLFLHPFSTPVINIDKDEAINIVKTTTKEDNVYCMVIRLTLTPKTDSQDYNAYIEYEVMSGTHSGRIYYIDATTGKPNRVDRWIE